MSTYTGVNYKFLKTVRFLVHPVLFHSITERWWRCQYFPAPDGPIPPGHTVAALPRLWSGGARTHALVGSPTPRSWRGSDPDCSAATSRAEWTKIMRRGRDCFWNTNILNFQISQGSVATQLRWGGSLYNMSIENFLRNLTVKELWKSVFICRTYDQNKVAVFGTRCR